MPTYIVVSPEIGRSVWQGSADNPRDACAHVARVSGTSTGEFRPYEFEPPEHKEDSIERMVLAVYAMESAPADGAPLPEWQELDEETYVGTFMALCY